MVTAGFRRSRRRGRRAALALSVVAAAPVAGIPPAGAVASHHIHDIQGAAHRSPLEGANVTEVPGVVTAVRNNGFWFEDPVPDADPRTSEGLFVFTSTAPAVAVGDSVLVSGTVSEFRPGGASGTNNLSTTQVASPGLTMTVTSSGNPLPATAIGGSGRVPPTMVIDDDAVGGSAELPGEIFDVENDGIDFWESLEGMRLVVPSVTAVGPSTSFGEIPVLADGIPGAGLRTARSGILVRAGDFNPERLFLDDEILNLLGQATPVVNVADTLSGVVGVLDYSFGNFKLQVTAVPTVTPTGLAREAASPAEATQLSVATFNVENLDPGDPQNKFDGLAAAIVANLRSPDLLTVEEIQDNNGPVNDAVVDASATYTKLISAVAAAGGPSYEFRQIDPVDDADGGESGGNIRVGFLFRTDRGLSFVDRPGGGPTTAVTVGPGPSLSVSPGRIDPTSPAFTNSRKPLAGEFQWQGRPLFAIGVHFNSKGGDQPLFGRFQPPTLSSEPQRLSQASLVRDFVRQLLNEDSATAVVVLGDVNDFEFSPVATVLEDGGAMHSLMETLPASERYSYVFEGNSQTLDQMFVSSSLASASPQYDPVHINSEFATQLSDHDPQVARFTLPGGPPLVVPEARRSGLLLLSGLLVATFLGARRRRRRPVLQT